MSPSRFLPWVVTALAACYLVIVALPPRVADGKSRLYEFGKLPVSHDGRVKPIDTLARTSLMALSGRQDFKDERDGPDAATTEPAVKWLLDLITGGQRDPDLTKHSWEQKVFHLEDGKLLEVLGLQASPGFLFDLEELRPSLKLLMGAAAEWEGIEPDRLNSSQRAILGVARQIRLYVPLAGRKDKVFRIENDQVLALLDLQPRAGYRYASSEFASKLGPLLQQSERIREIEAQNRNLFDRKVIELMNRLTLYVQLSQLEKVFVIPPAAAGEEWKELNQASTKNPVAQGWEDLLTAYSKDQPVEFNRAVASCLDNSNTYPEGDQARASFEVLFNHFAPFYQCALLFGLVIVLAGLGWLPNLEFLQRSAFWLAALALVVYTLALLARMYLSGRWLVFVTNLYSSAVFIGWMCVITGLVLQCIFRNGIGNMVAGLTGVASLIVAHHLGSDGDTLAMLQAVLDTNFWLATHVTCITIGYAATFMGGFLAWGYIFARVLPTSLRQGVQKELGQMIYGIICFATLFSFTGTVLGGIWADQSWGRFWGWDPKENGALLIVLMNALILHARWSGLAKQRGIAMLAVVGNMVTGWSWFGTNQLGVGLHAYGFNNTLALGLTIFWIVNVTVILLGLIPLGMWQNMRALFTHAESEERSHDLAGK